MKKLSFTLASLFFSALVFTSCGSEENVTAKTETFKFEKTTEMLNFEIALQNWMKYSQENKGNQETAKAKLESETRIANEAKTLLVSIGIDESELTAKGAKSTQNLVLFAMEAYSKKLTEMYNEQKNKN